MNIMSIGRTIRHRSALTVIRRRRREAKSVKSLIVQRGQEKNKARTKGVEF